MTTGAVDPVFADTNIVVFMTDTRTPLHLRAVAAIQRFQAAGVTMWISRQVLREYAATVTRPQSWGAARSAAATAIDLDEFERIFTVADETRVVTANLRALLAQFPTGGKQVHDANIVATMQAYGVRRLLTHNTADFAHYAGLIDVLPL